MVALVLSLWFWCLCGCAGVLVLVVALQRAQCRSMTRRHCRAHAEAMMRGCASAAQKRRRRSERDAAGLGAWREVRETVLGEGVCVRGGVQEVAHADAGVLVVHVGQCVCSARMLWDMGHACVCWAWCAAEREGLSDGKSAERKGGLVENRSKERAFW